MLSKIWNRKLLSEVFSSTTKSNWKKATSKLFLISLEDRIVPAVPFSSAFPHALSITNSGVTVTSSTSFTVTFNQPVIGVDTTDFQLVSTGTVANGTIASVTGSGATYTLNVTGITGDGTLGLNLVDLPSITALPSFASHQTTAVGTQPYGTAIGDVNGDGKLDLVVANKTDNNTGVLIGNGNGTFQTMQTFGAGTGPKSVALGDVNGDGKLDLVVANQDNNAGVLIGNGNGTFQTMQTFVVGTDPRNIELGDVNGDGKLDIVTANRTTNNISVLLGNGNGIFQAQQSFAVGTSPTSVALGDVNGDGRLDIVTTNQNNANTSVLLNTGGTASSVTFSAQQTFTAGSAPFSVALGDVNGDGKLDIVTANAGPNNTSVLLGNGDGTFQAQQNFGAGNSPKFVTLGDVNGDGQLDIITANSGTDNASVLLGNGNGTFRARQDFSTGSGSSPLGVILGDINSDGRLDIVAINNGNASLSVLLGNGGSAIIATFSSPQSFSINNGGDSVDIGDVNNDGKLDIVTANASSTNLSVLLGNGDGTYKFQQNFAPGGGGFAANRVTLGDVNNDGKLDIATISSNGSSVYVLLGSGDGTFNNGSQFSTGGSYTSSVSLGDLDRDGNLDIVVTHYFQTTTVSVLRGNGNGTFKAVTSVPVGFTQQDESLGDVNGDGILDIITANYGNDKTSVLLGNGNGTFKASQTFTTGANSGPMSIVLGDVDGDGRLDILTANRKSNNISVIMNTGGTASTVTFSAQQTFAAGINSNNLSLGDMNADGKLDVVVLNSNLSATSKSTSVLFGNGDGTFQAQQTYDLGGIPLSIDLGDMNNDGRLDIVTSNRGTVQSYASVQFNSLAFTGQTVTVQNTLPAPTVTNVNPASGSTLGGTNITITGTSFTGATGVTIGGVAATNVTVVNATTITATTPARTAGTASVVVTTPSGSNSVNTLFAYVVVPAPTVTNVNPASGSTLGGTNITITGTSFTGATGVTIGGAAATNVTVVNATTITATTPARSAGTASVVVTTPSGSNSANTLFTYVSLPTITNVNPSSGLTTGGTNITITGTNFTGATGVTIGGAAATNVTVVNATTITATTPAGPRELQAWW